jgi:hypothetical protein
MLLLRILHGAARREHVRIATWAFFSLQSLSTALARGDLAQAYSKATMTSRLTREMVAEARDLLRLMGVPTVQAPSEGEAQAAHMAATAQRRRWRWCVSDALERAFRERSLW